MLSLHERPNRACIAESAKQPLKQVSELLETDPLRAHRVHDEINDGSLLPLLGLCCRICGVAKYATARLENHFLDFLAMKLLIAAMPPLPLSF